MLSVLGDFIPRCNTHSRTTTKWPEGRNKQY